MHTHIHIYTLNIYIYISFCMYGHMNLTCKRTCMFCHVKKRGTKVYLVFTVLYQFLSLNPSSHMKST